MARSRSASRLAAIALVCAALGVGCRLFVDLDGLQGGAPLDDAGRDASATDAQSDGPSVDAPVDAPPSDSGPDVVDTDADASSEPCSDPTPLVGSNVVVGKSPDGTDTIDAVGFTVPADGGGVARCAWLYVSSLVDASAATTNIAIGVYANGGGDAPSNRIASAVVTNIVAGWNHAPLAAPLTVTPNEDVWLSFSASAGAVNTEVSNICGVRFYQHSEQDMRGAPPVFTTTASFVDSCDSAIYLGP